MRASRREAEDRLTEFKVSTGSAGSGPASGGPNWTTDKALSKVERAQAASARITGVPASETKAEAASIEELGRLARDRAIAERLRRLKGGN